MRQTYRAIPNALLALAAAALAAIAMLLAIAADSDADTARPYTYFKTRGTYVNTSVYGGHVWSVYQPQIVEQWIAEDGSGRQRTVSLVPRFVSPRDRETWEEAGRPVFLAHGFQTHTGSELLPAGSFGEDRYKPGVFANMPLDPAALSAWLRDRANGPTRGGGNGFRDSVKTLELVAELLQNPTATAEQRAALYAAVALVPGVEQLGEAQDEIGRHGVALGARSDNSGAPTLYWLIFDPDTSRALASKTEQLAPPAALVGQDGPVVSSTTYLDEGATASRVARPRAGRGHR